jgi:hypothetical protein
MQARIKEIAKFALIEYVGQYKKRQGVWLILGSQFEEQAQVGDYLVYKQDEKSEFTLIDVRRSLKPKPVEEPEKLEADSKGQESPQRDSPSKPNVV